MRSATIERKTKETDDHRRHRSRRQRPRTIATGIGFFDHMLDQLARHGLFDLDVTGARATCTSTSTTRSRMSASRSARPFRKALGDMRGITAMPIPTSPMDEALTRCAVDVSGRPYLVWKVVFTRPKVGDFDTELFREFFQAFAQNAGITLHVETSTARTTTTSPRPCFKALARTLRAAVAIDPRQDGRVPSTKGSLGD